MTNNHQKYLSYREAWRRVNAAIEAGFYFEAVTICESVISDRLFSYVQGQDRNTKIKLHSPFSQLIAEWRKLAGPKIAFKGVSDLASDVDAWRKMRNIIVHGIVKSAPGTPTEDVGAYMVRAHEAAIHGKRLARLVSDWHKQQLALVKNG